MGRLFAIGDLHLSGANPKTMDIFGVHWENHWQKIKESWQENVGPDDTVIIPGDISWAMTLKDALVDLNEIAELNGKKVLMRGNHDYWWGSISQLRSVLSAGMYALQNDFLHIDGVSICGTRGWLCPRCNKLSGAEDEKIYLREVGRLKLSLDAWARSPFAGGSVLAIFHFPPFNERQEPSGFTELLEEYGVKRAIYAHLHSTAIKYAFQGELNGIDYRLVSCDTLNFSPIEL